MATPDPFLSAREKLKRADVHYKELGKLVERYAARFKDKRYRMFEFDQEYRARSHCIAVFITNVQAPNVEWGVRFGDVLHNLRSALDHIAWALVEAGKRPPSSLSDREQQAVSFPIFRLRADFNDAIRPKNKRKHSCLPGVGRTQLAIVRACQPYRGGKRRADRHSLAVLKDLSNRDKHRAIQIALWKPFDPEIVLSGSSHFAVRRLVVARKALRPQPGTELAWAYGRREGPSPRLNVEIMSGAEPSIEGRHWLGDLYAFNQTLIEGLIDVLTRTIT